MNIEDGIEQHAVQERLEAKASAQEYMPTDDEIRDLRDRFRSSTGDPCAEQLCCLALGQTEAVLGPLEYMTREEAIVVCGRMIIGLRQLLERTKARTLVP